MMCYKSRTMSERATPNDKTIFTECIRKDQEQKKIDYHSSVNYL